MLYYSFCKIRDITILETSLAVPYNKHAAVTSPSNYSPGHLAQRNEELGSSPNLFIAALLEIAGNHRCNSWAQTQLS